MTIQVISGVQSNATCGVLIFVHVPKSGGQSITEILQGIPGWMYSGPVNSRLPFFLAGHGSLFNESGSDFPWATIKKERRWCAHLFPNTTKLEGDPRCETDWKHQRQYIDLHETKSHQIWVRLIRPKLRELRQRYAAAGCFFQTATLVREPQSMTLSHFLYFSLAHFSSLRWNSLRQTEHFERWLAPKANSQLAFLLGDQSDQVDLNARSDLCYTESIWKGVWSCSMRAHAPCGLQPIPVVNESDKLCFELQDNFSVAPGLNWGNIPASKIYLWNRHSCNARTRYRDAHAHVLRAINSEALGPSVLNDFDVVGTSENVGEMLWAMAARVGIVFNATYRGGGGSGGSGSGSGGSGGSRGGDYHAPAVAGMPRCNPTRPTSALTLNTLAPASRALLYDRTRCDHALYVEARRREALELAATSQWSRRHFHRRHQSDDKSNPPLHSLPLAHTTVNWRERIPFAMNFTCRERFHHEVLAMPPGLIQAKVALQNRRDAEQAQKEAGGGPGADTHYT